MKGMQVKLKSRQKAPPIVNIKQKKRILRMEDKVKELSH